MPSGTRSGREYQVPIGRISRSRPGNAQRTMRMDTPGHRCTCGKLFPTERGMKIHRTKMKCASKGSDSQNRTSHLDKTCEDTSLVANQNASDITIDDSELFQALEGKRSRILFPPAMSKEWETLDDDLDQKLKKSLRNIEESQRMKAFTDIIYYHCLSKYGSKKLGEKPTLRQNRRQKEMENIRREKNNLKKLLKTAPDTEKAGLKEIWRHLCARHSALSKAERTRKKKIRLRQTRKRFMRNPYQFGKGLFEQQRSGELKIDKEELESHLEKSYADKWRGEELGEIPGLVWPGAPGLQMDTHPPSRSEIDEIIKKSRTKSAPGPNGIPYVVYKRCSKVRNLLSKLLCYHWVNDQISEEWNKAEGVYIPKEKKAEQIGQFRPISLLNVEGKIFFTIVAKRLTKYLLTNGYIDISVQKGGIPGMPGCLEHAGMIWESIQRAKSSKLDLNVVWLDLANAYGSVPHKLIWLALEMFHVPKCICDLLRIYFNGFTMRFSTKEFDTKWIELQTGIAMGCSVSPILFVMAMQLLLDGTKAYAETANLGDGLRMNPLKAFMDDTTIVSSSVENTRIVLQRLDELIKWSRMEFKPKKSRSLTLKKGKVSSKTIFEIGKQRIPTVSEQPVKSLGRLYDSSIKDTRRAKETEDQLKMGLRAIDKCMIIGKFKLWILQFILIPKILWPLTMYEITHSSVEKLESLINRYTKKWLGLPKCMTDVALYCRQSKLSLPLKSLLEEYKIGKSRLQLMYQNSQDENVRSTEPNIRTGRKWKVSESTQDAVESLKIKEIMGHTQQHRRGFGNEVELKLSQVPPKSARDMILAEIKKAEDDKRVQKAIQQAQQGLWTTWEGVVQRSLSWNEIWQMPTMKLGFIIRSTYDLLPTRANLAKWYQENDKCSLCGGCETLKHILNGCKIALAKGRYTWRHNRVLQSILEVIKEALKEAESPKKPTKYFVKEGDKTTSKIESNTTNPRILEADDWIISADLPNESDYPPVIKQTKQRPDITLFSKSKKTILLIELTVPFESNIEEQHEFKLAKYQDLKVELTTKGFKVKLFAIEVGSRGFLTQSIHSFLKQLGLTHKQFNKAVRNIATITENASFWIWSKRNELDWRSV